MVRKAGKPMIVARMDKRKLAEHIKFQHGFSQREAENAINAVFQSMAVWIRGIIRDIPEGAQASACIQGFGRFDVRYAQSARHSAWRDKVGIPQRPALIRLAYIPATGIKQALTHSNRPMRDAYQAVYRPARAAWLATRPPGEEERWKKGKGTGAQDANECIRETQVIGLSEDQVIPIEERHREPEPQDPYREIGMYPDTQDRGLTQDPQEINTEINPQREMGLQQDTQDSKIQTPPKEPNQREEHWNGFKEAEDQGEIITMPLLHQASSIETHIHPDHCTCGNWNHKGQALTIDERTIRLGRSPLWDYVR